jgi:tetratricopeptide (TPR) repeat protein
VRGLMRFSPLVLGLALAIPLMISTHVWLNSQRGYGLVFRQFLYLYPIWLGLAALGFHTVGAGLWALTTRHRWTQVPAALAIVAGLVAIAWAHVPGLRAALILYEREDWRWTARLLERLVSDTDDVVGLYHYDVYVEHYWPELSDHPGLVKRVLTAEEIEEARGRGERVFIFIGKSAVLPDTRAQQIREIADLPQIRLDLHSDAWLACIPEEGEGTDLELLDSLLANSPPWEHDGIRPLTSLAINCLSRGHRLEAVDGLVERALSSSQPSPRPLWQLGNSLQAHAMTDLEGRVRAAHERHLQLRIATSYQQRGYHLCDLAFLMDRLGDREESIRLLRRMQRFTPPTDRAYFRFRLAEGLMRRDRASDEAHELLCEAIGLNPHLTYLWPALAQNLRAREDWRALIQVLRNSQESPSGFPSSLAPFATECLVWLSETDDLSEQERGVFLRQLTELLGEASGTTALLRAAILLREGDSEGALEASRLAVESDPLLGSAHSLRAMAAEELGLSDEALEAWTQAVCLSTGEEAEDLWERAHEALARRALTLHHALAEGGATAWQCHLAAQWLHSQGHTDEALEVWNLALATGPPIAEYHLRRHRILLRQGQIEEAYAAAESALALSPDHLWGHFYLAQAAEQLGDTDMAWEHAARAVELGINQPGATELALNMAMAVGDHEGGVVIGLIALEQRPDDSLARFHIAQCLLALDRLPEAQEIYEPARGAHELNRHSGAVRDLERELGIE